MKLAAIILAAGEGTRMKSDLPKVLHRVAGRPLLTHVLGACEKLPLDRELVVVGYRHELVRPLLPPMAIVVHQAARLGTADAVRSTHDKLIDFNGAVLVLAGDAPLIKTETLREAIVLFAESKAAALVLTADVADPFGYGRIVRGRDGAIEAIVEENEASPEEKAITEVNSGIYCFDAAALFKALAAVTNENRKGEYYLTDVVAGFFREGRKVLAHKADPSEIMGVNSRYELAQADVVIQGRLKKELMESGVTFVLPETTYIESGVRVGRDSTILPQSYLEGDTVIGAGAVIGPAARVTNSTIGDNAAVQYSVLNGCLVGEGVNVGPYASLRPGAVLKKNAKAGTFVEIKESEVGEGSKVPHLSYIGDAVIGKNANIGAGTITCNYDGVSKHRTVIEDGAFIGSDTMLVAPVKIGRRSVTAAGSSITKDVPPESLAVERSEQKTVRGWAKKRLPDKS